MFKEIFDALRRKDALSEMFTEFAKMLEIGRWMFAQATAVTEQRLAAGKIREELFTRDQRINSLERSIRERLVVHLVTGREPDVGTCLALMSVVKDAERIGDYCKNLFLVGEQFQGQYDHEQFTAVLGELSRRIDDLFPLVQEAFADSSRRKSERAVAESVALRKQCDQTVQQLLTPGGAIAPDEAAAVVMRTRFSKRIAAHLGNIATSVNNPVPMLDYGGKKPLDEPEG